MKLSHLIQTPLSVPGHQLGDLSGRRSRSAGFQPAVSQVSNLRSVEWNRRSQTCDTLPTGSRRYSRLETCATRGVSGCGAEFMARSAERNLSRMGKLHRTSWRSTWDRPVSQSM